MENNLKVRLKHPVKMRLKYPVKVCLKHPVKVRLKHPVKVRLKHPVKAHVYDVQDFIVEFIREKTIADPLGKIRKAEFNQQFTIWYRDTYGTGTPSKYLLHGYMNKRFGHIEHKGYWSGVKIKYEIETLIDEEEEEYNIYRLL